MRKREGWREEKGCQGGKNERFKGENLQKRKKERERENMLARCSGKEGK